MVKVQDISDIATKMLSHDCSSGRAECDHNVSRRGGVVVDSVDDFGSSWVYFICCKGFIQSMGLIQRRKQQRIFQ
jgi:hypothetical protein